MELAGVSILGAFVGGIVSFLSPCVLPLVPGYVSYISGDVSGDVRAGTRPTFRIARLSLFFIFGFTTVFALLGATASTIGRALLYWREELGIVGGAIIIVFGLFMIGVIRPFSLLRDWRFHPALRGGTASSAYLLGLSFAFGWTPCIGPILGSILTVSAGSATVSQGVALLVIYGMGLGVPFLFSAVFAETFSRRLAKVGRLAKYLQILAGVVLVAMGVAMVTGYLPLLAYWLLEAFPALARIG